MSLPSLPSMLRVYRRTPGLSSIIYNSLLKTKALDRCLAFQYELSNFSFFVFRHDQIIPPIKEETQYPKEGETMKLSTILLAVVLLTSACARTRLALPQPVQETRSEAAALLNSPIDEPRDIPPEEMLALTDKVDKRVLGAAVSVCQRTFNNPEICPATLYGRKLTVATGHSDINAFMGTDYDMTILGGLIRETGNDDELAMVMAHEYSHALFGHVRKRMRNAAGGEILGSLLGLAVGAAGSFEQEGMEQVITGAGSVGRGIGSLVFSKDMELEADHLALFMVDEAGYDVRTAMQVMVRLWRLGSQTGGDGHVGFLETHPTSEERIMRLLATERMIQEGAKLPKWKQ